MYEICSFSHYRLAAMYVKNCPNFCSVFRQPFSAARPDRSGSYKTEEIFHIGITRDLKIRAVFTPKRVRAFNPSLHFIAQHLAYRPCAQVPQNKEGPVGLPLSYTKWIATLMFSVTRLKSHSFTRETQTFKEIRHLLGLRP